MKWNKISDEVYKFTLGNTNILNIVTLPYNDTDIFLKVISIYVNKGNKVLYISSDKNIKEKHRGFIDVSRVHYTTIENLEKIDSHMELVIYDDISGFNEITRSKAREKLKKFTKDKNCKVITCSIEKIYSMSPLIYIPYYKNKRFFTEFRVIKSRVNLKKEISLSEYDYIKWSIKMNRNVAILTKDIKDRDKIYSYFKNIKEEIFANVNLFEKKIADRIMKDENAMTLEIDRKLRLKYLNLFKETYKNIVVSSDREVLDLNMRPMDIVVHNCSESSHSYKKLLFLCGKVTKEDEKNSGEVILSSNKMNDDMEIAETMAKKFNKDAWEIGAFN